MEDVTDQDIEDTVRALGVDPTSVGNDADTSDTLKAMGLPDYVIKAVKTPPAKQAPLNPSLQMDFPGRALLNVPVAGPLIKKGMAALGAIPGMGGSKNSQPTFGERYDTNLNLLDRMNHQYGEDHPVLAPLADVTGAAASIPFLPERAGAAVMGNLGPTVGARSVIGGLSNAAVGGADAFLRGDNPITGAEIGGAFGAAGPLLGEGARNLTNWATDYLPKTGPLKDLPRITINRLHEALGGETPASIDAAKSSVGPTAMIGDLNPAMTDIAGGLADTAGPQKAMVRQAYLDRAAGQGQRITDALDTHITPAVNVEALKNQTVEARAAAADPLYEQWRSMSVQPTPEIKALIPRLEAAGAFDRAEKISGITGNPINKNFFTTGPQKAYPTTESWDYVKQGLDSAIDGAYSSGDKTVASKLVQLKSDLIGAIGKTPAGKVWDQARSQFATHSSLLDNLDAGKDTFLGGRSGTTPDQFAEELKTLSGPELQARIIGARSAASDAMGATLKGDSTLRNKLLAPNNQEKLKLLLGKDRAQKLIDTLNQEGKIADQTGNVIGNQNTGASGAMRSERVKALQPPPVREYNPDLTQPLSLLPNFIKDPFRPSHIIQSFRNQAYANSNNQLAHIVTSPVDQAGPIIPELMKDQNRRLLIDRNAQRIGNALSTVVNGPTASVAYRRTQQ